MNYVSPPDACTVVKPPPQEYAGLWIALVRRFNCSFVDKVINAQHAGYAAVIVHNVGSNSLRKYYILCCLFGNVFEVVVGFILNERLH